MKTLLSTAIAVTLVVAGLVAAPEPTRAQSTGDGQPASGTPTVPSPSEAPTPGTAAQPAPTPAAEEDAAPEDAAADDVVVREEHEGDEYGFGGGAGRNVVYVLNRSDGRTRMRSRIRLVHVKGDRAEPVNAAFTYASCTDCQSFAVALEIALVAPNASVIAPQNRARAINYECTRCVTVARALQYVYAVDDPDQIPDNVNRLTHDMEKELRDIERDRNVTPADASARISAVIAQFQDLNASLQDEIVQTEDVTSPGATPVAAPSSEPLPAPMPSPSPATS